MDGSEEKSYNPRNQKGSLMDTLAKSQIIKKFTEALNDQKDFEFECIQKKTQSVIKITLTIKERETRVDADGTKWVRA
jgi:hypothetical protein